ncbi:hypothetical protein KY290_011767 [Solanum tuberosum]|uniref:Uncharacterized protein n=1 Tax=Solanum tuberosum TaxID=4113 RepID=A0ABQ7W3S2_SOLTU|nr:hypothetical protein KY290_011767 [Solanum tuberosum]
MHKLEYRRVQKFDQVKVQVKVQGRRNASLALKALLNFALAVWVKGIVQERLQGRVQGAWKAPPPLEVPRGLCLSRVSKRSCSREASRPVKGLHCPYKSLVDFSLANFWQEVSPRKGPRSVEDLSAHGALHVGPALARLGSARAQVRVHGKWTSPLPV